MRLLLITALNLVSLYSLRRLWRAARPTTARATTAALLDAAVQERTQATTQASWLQVQPTIETGRVEQGSECAHEVKLLVGARPNTRNIRTIDAANNWWCESCGALWYQGLIRAPAVSATTSTSAKQDSSQSAVTSAGDGATSASSGWTKFLLPKRAPLPPSDEEQVI